MGSCLGENIRQAESRLHVELSLDAFDGGGSSLGAGCAVWRAAGSVADGYDQPVGGVRQVVEVVLVGQVVADVLRAGGGGRCDQPPVGGGYVSTSAHELRSSMSTLPPMVEFDFAMVEFAIHSRSSS